MAKLNQIIAVEKGAKSAAETAVTKAYHQIQKAEAFAGLSRTYTPKDDEGEQLPGEAQKVIVTVAELVDSFSEAQTRLFDITATKLWANCEAKADVVVDGTVLLPGVPVEYLLFLEKRLADFATFVGKVPTLDPAFSWHWDEASGTYRTDPVRTHRTKKTPRTLEKAPATDKHPAQVEVYLEDETVGYWDSVKFSGAVPVTLVNRWKERIAELSAAVKMAREEANSIQAADITVGERVLAHVFV